MEDAGVVTSSFLKFGQGSHSEQHANVQRRVLRGAGLYLFGGPQSDLQLELPSGDYNVEWLRPVTGRAEPKLNFKHAGGPATLKSPTFEPDIALRIAKR
jgi:hypothetical protein